MAQFRFCYIITENYKRYGIVSKLLYCSLLKQSCNPYLPFSDNQKFDWSALVCFVYCILEKSYLYDLKAFA